jgi:hypothetical protein
MVFLVYLKKPGIYTWKAKLVSQYFLSLQNHAPQILEKSCQYDIW